MASFPTAKVHRPSRNKLGRGQSVQRAETTVSVGSSMATVTLTFNDPVVVSGLINMNVSGGLTLVSQTQTDALTVEQVYSGAVGGKTWSIGQDAPVATFQGGGLASASGTF